MNCPYINFVVGGRSRSSANLVSMKLSQILSQLLVEYADRPLPLHALLKQAGNNGFGTITGILTIPMLIPIPIPLLGFSALMGSGIILVGCQLAIGYDRPSLPQRIDRLELSPAASQKLLKNIVGVAYRR
jgi:hypothetical protein